MAQLSQVENQQEIKIFESQIRECFGRVVYSHKTHEKCADICIDRLSRIKVSQIILSAITSGSFIITIIGNGKTAAIIGIIFSTVLLGLNLYTKNYDLGKVAQKHKDAADKLWDIRESYLSLLTDIGSSEISIEKVRIIRDRLQKKLASVYVGAPRTNSKAYKGAQDALKKYEDMTFSDAEIDAFLPEPLRRAKIT